VIACEKIETRAGLKRGVHYQEICAGRRHAGKPPFRCVPGRCPISHSRCSCCFRKATEGMAEMATERQSHV